MAGEKAESNRKREGPLRDKLEQDRREELIQACGLNLKSLFNLWDSLPFGLLITDDKGRPVFYNNCLSHFFSEFKHLDLNAEIWNYLTPLTPYKAVFEKILITKKSFSEQKKISPQQIFNIQLIPAQTTKGTVVIFILTDLTHEEKFTQQTIQSQKMAAIQTLLSGLTHDFNNILSGMLMTVDYLKQYFVDPAQTFNGSEIAEEIEILSTSVRRATDLVQQLLMVTIPREANVVPLDLKAVLERILKICRQSFDKSIVFQVTLPDEEAIIKAEVTQIEQVILNVLINASHAMTIMRHENENWGGLLTIDLRRTTLRQPLDNHKNELSEGDFWQLSIEDTGVGMSEDVQKRIFEPFFTTKNKNKGLGLGLATVYNIVTCLRGHISVYSEPGRGTAFHIYFPVEVSRPYEAPSPHPTLHLKSGTIIVIEDEEYIRRSLERLLQKAGFEVFCAANGPEGLELLRNHQHQNTLILLDMVMPGESGKTVFQELMAIAPDTKIVLMSGFRKDERVEELLRQGGRGFLQKPFDQEELITEIERILGL